jgi:hypothetical protein
LSRTAKQAPRASQPSSIATRKSSGALNVNYILIFHHCQWNWQHLHEFLRDLQTKSPYSKKTSLQNSRYEIHMVVVENISTSRIVFANNVDFLTRI